MLAIDGVQMRTLNRQKINENTLAFDHGIARKEETTMMHEMKYTYE